MRERVRQKAMHGRWRLVAALLLAGCKQQASEPIKAAPEAVASASASASASAPAARIRAAEPVGPACGARRPYTTEEKAPAGRLVLPGAFTPRTPCEVLAAIAGDYDQATERSAKAGGLVRADQAKAMRWQGRDGLVVSYYEGDDAAETMLCGMCRAQAKIAWLVEDGGHLSLVARSEKTIEHGGYDTASLELAPEPLRVSDDEELLAFEANLSGGTSPGRRVRHVLRRVGAKLERVAMWPSGSSGMGASADGDRVESKATFTPRPRAGQLADLVVSWSKASCPFDDAKGDYLCGTSVQLGTETLRFDGRTYRRQGPGVKVPFF